MKNTKKINDNEECLVETSNSEIKNTKEEIYRALAKCGKFLIISDIDYGTDTISIDGEMYSIRDIIKQLPKKAIEALIKDLGVSNSTLKRYFNGEISQEIAVKCAAAWAVHTGKAVQSGKSEIISFICTTH